jgi:hypothetical protein
MMWRSMKARDLQRDARCVLHSAATSADGGGGEFKLYGRAGEIDDLEIRAEYAAAVAQRIPEFDPSEPFHLFALDLEHAWFQRVHPDPVLIGWP